MTRQVVVVYNNKSGSALPPGRLKEMFQTAGFDVIKMITVSDSLRRDLEPYTKNGHRIAAVGGDGTISAVAGIVAGTNAVLVPIPGGMLNNFTKDLGVDQDIEKAIAAAAKASPKTVDIASVNNLYFINNSSIGVYPRSLVVRESIQTKFGKWPVALIGVVRTLVRFRTYRVTIDGKSVVTPFIFVGNNDYGLEKSGLSNRTRLDGGKLCVYIINSPRRLALARLFIKSLLGTLSADSELIMYRTSSMTIDSKRPRLHVSHDGEISTIALPLRYEQRKGGLKVLG